MKITNSLIALTIIFTSLKVFSDDEATVSIYQPPEPISREAPRYPAREARFGGEGWVVVNYMVDTEGNIFDPVVIDSSGSKAFEDASLKALSNWKYSPANSEGKAIESGTSTMLSFKLEKDDINASARPIFVKRFRNALDAIKEGAWDLVSENTNKLSELTGKNHYEQAYLNYLEAAIAGNEGDAKSEYSFLTKSLQAEHLHDKPSEFLPEELTSIVRRRIFVLQVEQRLYAEALSTYQRLTKYDNPDYAKSLQPTIDQIKQVKNDDTVYWLANSTDENGRSHVNLLKRGFSVEIEEGAHPLQELKLHCQKKHAFFNFKNGTEYKIPESWGTCNLMILGSANTKYRLWQF